MQSNQETVSKEVIDRELALMAHICEPCKEYPTCILDPPKECDVFQKEVKWAQNWIEWHRSRS